MKGSCKVLEALVGPQIFLWLVFLEYNLHTIQHKRRPTETYGKDGIDKGISKKRECSGTEEENVFVHCVLNTEWQTTT